MARAKRIFTTEHPYHITARCINKDWFRLPMEVVWKIFSDRLYFATHAYAADIHAFVLMSNHFHLIMSTPLANIDKIMWYLLSEVSREVTWRSDRINQTFGGPYYSSVISSYHYFMHAYKYVYRNPVDAGMIPTAEGYRFSTLHGLLGFSPMTIPVVEDPLLFEDVSGTLSWINEGYKEGHLRDIEIALSKNSFTLPRNRSTRDVHCLEKEKS